MALSLYTLLLNAHDTLLINVVIFSTVNCISFLSQIFPLDKKIF